MTQEYSIATVAERLHRRFNTESGLELLGGLFAIAATVWIGFSIGIYGFLVLAEKTGSSVPSDTFASAFLLGAVLAGIALPLVLAGIALWHDRFSIHSIPLGAVVTGALTAAAVLALLMFDGASDLWANPLPVIVLKLVGAFVLVWAVVTPGIVTASLLYRNLTSDVSRRHVVGVAIAVLLLVAAGAGAAQGLRALNDDSDPEYSSDAVEYDGRTVPVAESWYHENSSVDAYHDYDTAPDPTEDPYVEEDPIVSAASRLPCESQPDAAVFQSVETERSYNISRVVVDPGRFWVQSWRHTRDGEQIHSVFRYERDTSFQGYFLTHGVVDAETLSDDHVTRLDYRLRIVNASSVTVYQDVITEDGEVVRYGAKLCRPDLDGGAA